MIFAAGKGTRLQPLSNNMPKALVKIGGIPMIEYQIKKIISFGFNEIIINVSHFADQIIEFIKKKNNFNIHISFSHEQDELLDTGGGLKKASWFFNDNKPFLVHNVDPLCNINLKQLYDFHLNMHPLATLAVKNRSTSRFFVFNSDNILCGWEFPAENKKIVSREFITNSYRIAFSCMQILDPEIFSLIEEEGAFSLTKLYLRLATDNDIYAYQHDEDYWFDMGSTEKLKIAEDFLLNN